MIARSVVLLGLDEATATVQELAVLLGQLHVAASGLPDQGPEGEAVVPLREAEALLVATAAKLDAVKAQLGEG